MAHFLPKANNLAMMRNCLEIREKRTATRYPVAMHVEFGGGSAWTLDISATGALIETDQPFLIGTSLRFFLVQPDYPYGASRILCNGTVVWGEQDGDLWRLGLFMEPVRFEG